MPDIGTRKLILKVGGTDYSASVSMAEIVAGEMDTDFVSFADALAGGPREYKLHIVLKQDTAASSLWYFAWANVGQDVAFELWPNGGTVPSATTPKVTGTANVREPDGTLLGGEASPRVNAKQTIECEWICTGKPVMNIV